MQIARSRACLVFKKLSLLGRITACKAWEILSESGKDGNYLYEKQPTLFCANADKLAGNCANANYHKFKADSVKYLDNISEISAFNAEAPMTRLFYHLPKITSHINFVYNSNCSDWQKAKNNPNPWILCNKTFFTDNFSTFLLLAIKTTFCLLARWIKIKYSFK